MLLKEVSARTIKDSRGEDTIEVSVNGSSASAPEGKSTGTFETRPYNKNIIWNVRFINSHDWGSIDISSFDDLSILEKHIKKFAKVKDVLGFGANALFAFESAVLKALAKSRGIELWQLINSKAKKIPIPAGNIIGGGLHSHNEQHPTFQEFLIIPQFPSAAENISLIERYHAEIGSKLGNPTMNDEGAWQTNLDDMSVLQLLSKLQSVRLGIDIAANSFYCKGQYRYNNKELDRAVQIDYINSLIKKFNLLYVEDPLEENDFKGFSKIEKKNLIVGDDLTVTHISRLKKAIKSKSINAIIVKPNQNGSLLQVKKIVDFCKKNKIKTILSHRSGETLDNALADYAVAFGVDYIKCGIATQFRQVKLQRLLEIEMKIKSSQ
jgi:enolase